MKLEEYIADIEFINRNNCIQSYKYNELFASMNDTKYIRIDINEDILQEFTLTNILTPFYNKIILFSNVDIDFPPPKKPYAYDKYFTPFHIFDAQSATPSSLITTRSIPEGMEGVLNEERCKNGCIIC